MDVIKNIAKKERDWVWGAWLWTAIHYGLGLGGAVASVLAATLKDNLSIKAITFFNLGAALSATIVTVASPKRTADLFWTAARVLNDAHRRFHTQEIDIKGLNNAASHGENILAGWMGIDRHE